MTMKPLKNKKAMHYAKIKTIALLSISLIAFDISNEAYAQKRTEAPFFGLGAGLTTSGGGRRTDIYDVPGRTEQTSGGMPYNSSIPVTGCDPITVTDSSGRLQNLDGSIINSSTRPYLRHGCSRMDGENDFYRDQDFNNWGDADDQYRSQIHSSNNNVGWMRDPGEGTADSGSHPSRRLQGNFGVGAIKDYGYRIGNVVAYNTDASLSRDNWDNQNGKQFAIFYDRIINPMYTMPFVLSTLPNIVTYATGTFFDGAMLTRTMRERNILKAEAAKDYHTSEAVCTYGTFVRSIAKAEEKSRHDKRVMNDVLMARYLNRRGTSGADKAPNDSGEVNNDIEARLSLFKRNYCDLQELGGALRTMCTYNSLWPGGPQMPVGYPGPADLSNLDLTSVNPTNFDASTLAPDYHRINHDIDYAGMVDHPLTIDIDFTSAATLTVMPPPIPDNNRSETEEEIFEMARHLYWPVNFNIIDEKRLLDLALSDPANAASYMTFRSLVAKQNVAHNTFLELVSRKAKSPYPTGSGNAFVPTTVAPYEWLSFHPQRQEPSPNAPIYMKHLMRDFGLTDEEINDFLGEEPSYYAQMEVLTKKMYQLPNFYTNLYDKPANVKRINASLQAIQLMQLRDRYSSSLRREMLTSLLLENGLDEQVDAINNRIEDINKGE